MSRAGPRLAAGAERALEAVPLLAAPLVTGAGSGAGDAVPVPGPRWSTFTGLPTFAPVQFWRSRPSMMISLSRQLSPSRVDSLAVLHGVDDEAGKLDDSVLLELVVLDHVVELGRQHGLDEILAIGKDDTTNSSVIGNAMIRDATGFSPIAVRGLRASRRRVDAFDAQNLENGLNAFRCLRSRVGTLTKTSGKRACHDEEWMRDVSVAR